MKARGFTLLEIAIVLTVVLMLSSLLVTNYYSFETDRRNAEAKRQLEQIKTAIVNYAAAHSTVQRSVEVFNVTATTPPATITVLRLLPAGRPYLPCPDITGDGLEDRIAPPDATTATLSIIVADAVAHTANDYPLEIAGGCQSSRGAVPWNTLDAPAVDPWGRRYSYRVAGVFSNAQTGFDQSATGGPNYAARPLSPAAAGNASAPALSIAIFSATSDTTEWTGLRNRLSPFLIYRCDASSDATPGMLCLNNSDLAAGATATATMTLFNDGGADFDGGIETALMPGDMISGVPFVVLSHGENGYGAVRAEFPGTYLCNPFIGASPHEMQNAAWHATAAAAPPDPADPSAVPATHSCAVQMPLLPAMRSDVVVRDVGSRFAGDGFDDIVDWMSAPELVAALSELRALPARPLPPIGLER